MSETSSNSSRKRLRSDSSTNDDDDDDDLSTDQRIFRRKSSNLTKNDVSMSKIVQEFVELSREVERRKKIRRQNDEIREEKISFVLRWSSKRWDLFDEGFAVFSHENFPFRSLCYVCGSTGVDLIFCNQCAQVYHRSCLNESERSTFRLRSCRNCRTCQICGFNCKNSPTTTTIFCFDCEKTFHRRCLKSDENEHLNVDFQRWFCPSCIKCDCGQRIRSTDENLFPHGKNLSAQQTFMCVHCLNNFKDLRTKSNLKLEKCRLCQRYLSQYLTQSKPLFSLSLISQQTKTKRVPLFQCEFCRNYFHPECDGFLSEDVFIQNSIETKIFCSICDRNAKNEMKKKFYEKKFEILQNVLRDVTAILVIVVSNENENRFVSFERSMKNLQELHQSVGVSLNLQAFLHDLWILIDEFLSNSPSNQWKNAMENCFSRHFPSFSSRNAFLTRKISLRSPSIDHSYASNDDENLRKFSSKFSLLKFLDEKSFWSNFSQIDTRRCSICQTFEDETTRLVPTGLNHWTHFRCLSPTQSDSTNVNVEFDFHRLRLCIGSLQIEHFGHFDYLNNNNNNEVSPTERIYPDDFRASRIFWSTKNAKEKTIYHLKIQIQQNYHCEKKNHRTFSNPPTDEEKRENFFYEKFRKYFEEKTSTNRIRHSSDKIAEILSIDTKTLRNLFTPNSMKSSEVSRFALALVQALQQIDVKNETQSPIFSYYPIPQVDGTNDESTISTEELVRSFCEWKRSKFGRPKFFIESDDGFSIESDDLNFAWSNILEQIRSCRNEMKLTHLTMNNDELDAHQIFGLTKSIVKQLFQRILFGDDSSNNILFLSSPNSSKELLKKKSRRNFQNISSRTSIYQRKSSQRRCFAWLTNPHRTLQSALETFEIDEPLNFVRQILLQQSSVAVRLHFLSIFSDRVLFVGTSSIHGCGLFTLIDLVEGQMVIEYVGDVIRQSLTDQRERENERKGVGCYMFTIDSMNVIDSTYQGNKARFINHHCQPNCYAKTIESDGKKHIVIYAGMDIVRGSELTYDYSFQEEDIKIPCHCGTSECRMYLN